MSFSKLKLPVIAALTLAVVVVVFWQHQQNERMTAEIAALRGQIAEAAKLREQDAQSINRLKNSLRAEAERTQAERTELMRLRAQAARLRQSEQENAQLKSERDRLAKNTGPLAVGETKEVATHQLQNRNLSTKK